jgi:nucleotide-binding universal stress UspA family protein
MFRRILVPLDCSSLSEAVVPHIEKLISETNAEVTLLTVAESPAPVGTTTVESGRVRDVVATPMGGEPHDRRAYYHLGRGDSTRSRAADQRRT